MTNTSEATVALIQYLHEQRATQGLAVALCEVLALRRNPALIPVEVTSHKGRVAS